MKFSLGVKSDPIEYRYTFTWLFRLMDRLDIRYIQVGSFPALLFVDEGFLLQLREEAERYGVHIKSCFSSHREFGGFFSGNPFLEKAARKMYERFIHVAAVLGTDFCGTNPGTVPRDKMKHKAEGIECYLKHMKELMGLARVEGLKGLTMEPMSSLAEPPTLPEELDYILGTLADFYMNNRDTAVPAFTCCDISHGYADQDGKVIHGNFELIDHQVPFIAEFHLKNTDQRFDSTFGFSPEEQDRGIVDLRRLKRLIENRQTDFPIEHIVAFFETGGPKMGREYSDYRLEKELTESLEAFKKVFS